MLVEDVTRRHQQHPKNAGDLEVRDGFGPIIVAKARTTSGDLRMESAMRRFAHLDHQVDFGGIAENLTILRVGGAGIKLRPCAVLR